MPFQKIFVKIVPFLFVFLVFICSAEAKLKWPPQLNEPYPDLELIDQTGQPVRISDFKGSVILIEYIGMPCAACQAFSGAHDKGAFANVAPQVGLKSLEEYFPYYAQGISLSDKRIVYVQVVLYSMSMQAPQPNEVKAWAEHFGLDRSQNQVVLAGTPELVNPVSYEMIPGFHLIDEDLILRSDGTGKNQHKLYTELLPMVPKLIK